MKNFKKLLSLQGVFCNPEEAESNRHRPGSEREGHYLYGSHGVSPWRPPAGGAARCFGDFPGEVKEWDHQTDSSSDHHPHLCFFIKGSVWLLFRGCFLTKQLCLFSSLLSFLHPLQIDLSSILPEALSVLGSFLRKNQRALKLGTLACLNALVTHHAASIKPAALEPVLSELPALVDESDMHVSQVPPAASTVHTVKLTCVLIC